MREIKKEILKSLREIEEREGVKVLYAVESGSRAWGVASPDSDYDVRFVYLRPMSDYLQLREIRDVIEWQLDEILDINGWDLKKVLVQFRKGNATLFEWANSPVVYKTTEEWKAIYAVAKRYFSEKVALHHYYGTARSTYEGYLTGSQVRYKKYIYALRPILACQYIEAHHDIPPVLFEDLKSRQLPEYLKPAVARMLEIKSQTDERQLLPQIPEIQDFIEEELARLALSAREKNDDREADWEALNAVFLKILGGA